MNIKLTLGERLKDLRVERDLKLEALAEQTGLSKSALSKYESDDVTDLSIYAVTTLAEFYGVTTDYLLGVTENKKRPDAVLSDLHLSDGAGRNTAAAGRENVHHWFLCKPALGGQKSSTATPIRASFCHRTGACRSLSQPLFRVSRNQGVTH